MYINIIYYIIYYIINILTIIKIFLIVYTNATIVFHIFNLFRIDYIVSHNLIINIILRFINISNFLIPIISKNSSFLVWSFSQFKLHYQFDILKLNANAREQFSNSRINVPYFSVLEATWTLLSMMRIDLDLVLTASKLC